MVVETTPKKILDWIKGQDGTLIMRIGSVTAEIVTLYTVPTAKVLYVFHAAIHVIKDGTSANHIGVMVFGGQETMRLGSIAGLTFENVISASFPIPIKLTAAQTVQVKSSGSNVSSFGSFEGYEFDA